MLTPLIGIACLCVVVFVAMSEREATKLSFLDPHAAIVVVGGVIGALLLAIDRRSLVRMAYSVRELLPSTSTFSREMRSNHEGLAAMRKAWLEGRRAVVLEMVDKAPTPDLKVAADALLRQASTHAISEDFTRLRSGYLHGYLPVVEGWEMVGKLAPSFGMVGTVTGMVILFRNMGENAGNLGGAMAMALLATLYGITLGAAVGGPMASRVNTQLNDRLAMLDLFERTVTSLISDAGSASSSRASGQD